MAYYGVTGQYTKNPKYLHRDGTIHDVPDPTLGEHKIIGWHDECAYEVFNVDRTAENWGRWHHRTGKVWAPWKAGVPCEHCGEYC